MRVVFRVDSSSRIGDRPIARCRALATVLRQRGAEIRFVCRAHPGHLIEALTREAFPVTILPAPTETSQEGAERAPGVIRSVDAAETIAALNGEKPDWLIVDHCDLDADWERALRPHAGNLLAIDDLADRTHECDVLLHPSDSLDAEVRYRTLVPAACRRLFGSRYSLLDGLGARRVAEYIDPTPAEQLRLRPARPDDVAAYFDWVNDPEVRRQSLNSDPVSWQTHQEWFRGKLNDPNCRMFVLEAAALPVGQIRFDLAGDEARIDYSLDRIVRGRRWGAGLVTLGTCMLQDSAPIHLRAEVKETNKASCAVFMRLGFEEQSAPPAGDARFSICILSDRSGWLNNHLSRLVLAWLKAGHRVLWTYSVSNLRAGDFCFYLGCSQIVPPHVLARFRNNLVVHEGDLPKGKGWSPLTWQILEGKNRIPVTLFEATEKVDSGPIYAQEWLEFEGHELIDELREAQVEATLRLCQQFVADYPSVLDNARPQTGDDSFYARRKPSDSRLDPRRSLADQFNLLRVVDNKRYPAFFEWNGNEYKIEIYRATTKDLNLKPSKAT